MIKIFSENLTIVNIQDILVHKTQYLAEKNCLRKRIKGKTKQNSIQNTHEVRNCIYIIYIFNFSNIIFDTRIKN